MIVQKKITFLIAFLWLMILVLFCGPIRWEFAHTYAHWVEGLGDNLPVPTIMIGLPLLGLSYSGLESIILSSLIWLVIWGVPLYLLLQLTRTSRVEQVRDLILFGGGLYACILIVICAFFFFSLWLPFSYLG